MSDEGYVKSSIQDKVGTLTFFHPKGNSLPGVVLQGIAAGIEAFGDDTSVNVVQIKSEGERAFCGGASFDEFQRVSNQKEAEEFFSGFAKVIQAVKNCPKFVVARVQGKVVGGGVGVVAASDYAMATQAASIRLSELALGIGPFTIGPAVQRKIGFAAFNETAIDADWRDAEWALSKGLYQKVLPTISELDKELQVFLQRLAGFSPEAMADLKQVLWEGTENWDAVLAERVATTSKLVLTDYVQKTIEKIKSS